MMKGAFQNTHHSRLLRLAWQFKWAACLFLVGASPGFAQSAGAKFQSFSAEKNDAGAQIFRIEFDRAPAVTVHDELIGSRFFYLDYFNVENPGPDQQWSPEGDAVFHVKQAYYAPQRVLRFVFYTRGDAWFAVQTQGRSVQQIEARGIRYAQLGTAGAATGGHVKRVVIDAGHGGKPGDAKYHLGAETSKPIRGRTVYEKEITLQIAQKLEALLKKTANLTPVMTRDRDVYVSLEDRIAIANREQGDLFLSIHLNATSARRKTARGFEIYYLSDGSKETNRELVALENEGVSLDDHLSYEATLRDLIKKLADEAMGLRIAESRQLCEITNQEFSRAGPFRGEIRGVKSAPFRVLMNFEMPAALAECGFIDNPAEAEMLVRPATQDQIAVLLFNAINRYFAMQDPEFRPTRAATGN